MDAIAMRLIEKIRALFIVKNNRRENLNTINVKRNLFVPETNVN
jgi:hypothetical protein